MNSQFSIAVSVMPALHLPAALATFSNHTTVIPENVNKFNIPYCHNNKRLFSANIIGFHKQPISQVHFSQNESLLVTGSYDSTVGLWDPRISGKQTAVRMLPQPGDVYTLDTTSTSGGTYLVVGTEKRFVYIWDMRKLDQAVQMRDSSLKYQTRCIRCFPNGQGYALASIEGRVAVEFFEQSPEQQKRKYAFKCHRTKLDDVEFIYPVNVIAFHKVFNTFATGETDLLLFLDRPINCLEIFSNDFDWLKLKSINRNEIFS